MGNLVVNKINSKLRFLYRKNGFLTTALKRSLCNALIQPHFDYACVTWTHGLSSSIQNRLRTAQNKCIRFCLNLNSRAHIGNEHFSTINWLPVDLRVSQCVVAQAFKFCKNPGFNYMSEVFAFPENRNIELRNSDWKLDRPGRNKNMGRNCLSWQGPTQWNLLGDNIRATVNYNTFKHKVKELYLDSLNDIRRPNRYRR